LLLRKGTFGNQHKIAAKDPEKGHY